MSSALYVGEVIHHRYHPVTHSLRYRLFWMLIDLDELPVLPCLFFSHNRSNLVAFRDSDHLDGSDTPLRVQIEALLRQGGLDTEGGPIRVLCMPRVLGRAFNPISVYFCHHRDGRLMAMLYEVHNTFGERHSYLIPVTDPVTSQGAAVIRQRCDKQFYVSPFMGMDMTYDFRIVPPAATTAVIVGGALILIIVAIVAVTQLGGSSDSATITTGGKTTSPTTANNPATTTPATGGFTSLRGWWQRWWQISRFGVAG
jgi:DUF1365 family protein